MQATLFTSTNDFSQYIERYSYDNHMSCTDAILEYCSENLLDPGDISSMVSKSLKDKVAVEMREAGMLPKLETLEDL